MNTLDGNQVEDSTLDSAAVRIVDDVSEAICDLIRAVCFNDPELYRPMLERCAQRLGGV